MKYIIAEIQLKRIFEQSNTLLEPNIIKLFKFLNDEKKKHRKRSELLDEIKKLAPYLGVPAGSEGYLLELYLLNFRPDGDYKNLSKENFIDPRYMKGKLTSNSKADYYTRAQLPFRGSNLEGYWTKDGKGVPCYVVKSYGWYPVFIFRQGKWYEVSDKYSSSTAKQMHKTYPVEYDIEISEKMYRLTRQEMKMILDGKSHEEVMEHKLKKIKELEPELQNKRIRTLKGWRTYDEELDDYLPEFKVKFKIKSIDIEGDKAIVTVDIFDVLRVEKKKGVPTPENYLKGELEGVSPRRVELAIEWKLKSDLINYIGPSFLWHKELPPNSKISFKFNHLKK